MKRLDDILRDAAKDWDGRSDEPPIDKAVWLQVASQRRKSRLRRRLTWSLALCTLVGILWIWQINQSIAPGVKAPNGYGAPEIGAGETKEMRGHSDRFTSWVEHRPATDSLAGHNGDAPEKECRVADGRGQFERYALSRPRTYAYMGQGLAKPLAAPNPHANRASDSSDLSGHGSPNSPNSFGRLPERMANISEALQAIPDIRSSKAYSARPDAFSPLQTPLRAIALSTHPARIALLSTVDGPAVATRRTKEWRYALSLGPALVSSKVLINDFESERSSRWQWNAALRTIYVWPDGWLLGAGLEYAPIASDRQSNIQFFYNPVGERFDARRFGYQNVTNQRVSTPYGETDLHIAYLREPGAAFQNGQAIDANLSLDSRTQYLRVPLRVGMERGRGNWTWSIFTEIGNNARLNTSVNARLYFDTRTGIRELEVNPERWSSSLKSSYADWGIGGEVTRMFGPHWGLTLQVNDRNSIGSLSDRYRLHIRSSSIQIGLRFSSRTAVNIVR